MQRSYSDNHLCYSVNRIRASATQPKLKTSPSMGGIFNFQFSSSLIPDSLKSFWFDDPERNKEGLNVEEESDNEMEIDKEKKKANWVERIMEIQSRWREKQKKDTAMYNDVPDEEANEDCDGYGDGDGDDDGCQVDYDEEEDEEGLQVDSESFKKLLNGVSWSDTKLFSKLAFLCNLAYVIPEIKV